MAIFSEHQQIIFSWHGMIMFLIWKQFVLYLILLGKGGGIFRLWDSGSHGSRNEDGCSMLLHCVVGLKLTSISEVLPASIIIFLSTKYICFRNLHSLWDNRLHAYIMCYEMCRCKPPCGQHRISSAYWGFWDSSASGVTNNCTWRIPGSVAWNNCFHGTWSPARWGLWAVMRCLECGVLHDRDGLHKTTVERKLYVQSLGTHVQGKSCPKNLYHNILCH